VSKIKVPTVKRIVFELGQRSFARVMCEANVEEATARWRNILGQGYQCSREAQFQVDGVCLCKTHAGARLIKTLLKGEVLVARSPRRK
jgi:hypothetical protein